MKLLLDQGLPRSAASLLRATGLDAVHTGEIGLATADDLAIIQLAYEQERTVVTLDSDFHALLALSGATAPSVIRIRIEGLRAEQLSQLIQIVLRERENEINKGALLSVQRGRIRIRHLPIEQRS